MKIYTKKGDSGETSLLSGTRLPKHHVRIEAYGTVDELNASLGWLRDHDIGDEQRNFVISIQEVLFTMGSHLATDPTKKDIKLPTLHEAYVEALEQKMDEMDKSLPEMKNFVLPGGHPAVSACHMARCICRRAERWTTALHNTEPVESIILKYLNRLSDFLFVLSRKIAIEKGITEHPWKPKK